MARGGARRLPCAARSPSRRTAATFPGRLIDTSAPGNVSGGKRLGMAVTECRGPGKPAVAESLDVWFFLGLFLLKEAEMLPCAPERGEVGGALRSCSRHEELVHRLRALPPSLRPLPSSHTPTHPLTHSAIVQT